MARKTGVGGAVDGSACVRAWKIVERVPLDTAGWCSASPGGTGGSAPTRRAGNILNQGSYGAYGHTPARMPNDSFRFQGVCNDGTEGVDSGVSGALCTGCDIRIPIMEGRYVHHLVQFVGSGAWTIDTASASDATDPNPAPGENCSLKTALVTAGSEAGLATVTNVLQMRLVLLSKPARYADSSSSGRWDHAAGNLDAYFIFNIHPDDFGTHIPTKNSILRVQAYVTASTYWDVRWMKVEDIILDVPIEGSPDGEAKMVTTEIRCKWTGFDNAASPNEGCIVKPDTTLWWGTAP